MKRLCPPALRRPALTEAACLLLLSVPAAMAQGTQQLQPGTPPTLAYTRAVRAGQPFTVAGPRGVLVGQQERTFEAWILPVKLLSHFSLRAEVESYPVPIELNPLAATIEVFPDRTVITYTHLALTVRQTMFAPTTAAPGTGAVVLFQVQAVRPVELTFSFTPEMRPMWPKPTPGNAQPEWVASASAYVLHTDTPALAGALAIPGAQAGVLAPYQEKPQTHAVEFKLHFDPRRDAGKVYPLLMAVGQTAESASNAALLKTLADLNARWPALYQQNNAYYRNLANTLTRIETPDPGLNEDFAWAEMAIEQLRTDAQPDPLSPRPETSLVAGYFSSGDSARPGFGWFFGRDALYTLYAVNSMGDFNLTRQVLEFLLHRQRADGKIMHEYSQTAATTDWASLPYEYAAADATPLFLLAVKDYLQQSGDVTFAREHKDEILRAWNFERTHDTDGDGIYDNAQGTGWVEDWPGDQPHQEIYLALLDQQASAAVGVLAAALDEPQIAQQAAARATAIAATIEREYYLPASGEYAFSRNADGTLDRTRTLFPTLAWWSDTPVLEHPEASLRAWDSHVFSTDWGTRDVAGTDPIYDSMSYHRGSVWPLFTGWAALADYRAGRPLAGFNHLMQNAAQTFTQDPGAVTELLSGKFFTPFGRSTSHQLWSSAMVITPAVRGLFGLNVDAVAHTVSVNPQLPAEWPSAAITNLRVGESFCSLSFTRAARKIHVTLSTQTGPALRLLQSDFNLPAVEVSLPFRLPLPGAETSGVKVLNQTLTDHALTLQLEGPAGSAAQLTVRANTPGLHLHVEGLALDGRDGDPLRPAALTFPAGEGYTTRQVTLRW